MRESATTSHIRLAAAKLNCPLWRNNCGGFYDNQGRFVRYGLGSEAKLASSDFIGICPTVITSDMVGQTVGVFLAVEMKADNWHLNTNDKHIMQQKQFIDIVQQYGGLSGFATCVDDFYRIIKYGNK